MARSGILETKRLRLVPFSSEFLTERYVGWLNDKEVVRYSEQRFRTHTIDSCREYMRGFEGESPSFFWAVLSKDPSEGHIGNISGYVDPPNTLADVAILIGEKEVWNKGYGSESFSAVVDYLFRKEGMRKVTAGTVSANEAMIGVMKRAGMHQDGRRLRHYVFQGKEVDIVHYALFRDDWLRSKNQPCAGNEGQCQR